MAGRTIDLELETSSDDEDETRELTVNADNVTYVNVTETGPNLVWKALAVAGLAIVAYLFITVETPVAVGGSVVVFIVLALLFIEDEDIVLGTVTRSYDDIALQPDVVERQFQQASTGFASYESLERGLLSRTRHRYRLNPDTVVSVAAQSARNWRRAALIAILGVGAGVAVFLGLDTALVTNDLADTLPILVDRRLELSLGVGLVGLLIAVQPLRGDDVVEISFASEATISLEVPSDERERIVDELRREGDRLGERLLDLEREDHTLHVNVDNVTRLRTREGELRPGGYAAIGAAGLVALLAAHLGAGLELLSAALVGLIVAGIVAWYLYPRPRGRIETLVGTHDVGRSNYDGLVDEFDEFSQEIVSITGIDETPLWRREYEDTIVVQNVVYLDRDERDLRTLLIGLAIAVVVTVGSLALIRPIDASLIDRAIAGTNLARELSITALIGLGASVWLARETWWAIGPPWVEFAFENGATVRHRLPEPMYEEVIETMRDATDTLSVVQNSRLGRHREREFNIAELVAVTAREFEYYPRGFVRSLVLWLPVLYVGQFVLELAWLLGVLVIWAGLVLWLYRTPRFELYTPIGKRRLSAEEAEAFLDEVDAAASESIGLDGRITGLTVHESYETEILPDNVVSYEEGGLVTPGAFLYLFAVLAVYASLLIHFETTVSVLEGTVGSVLNGWLYFGGVGLVILVLLGIGWILVAVATFIHGYERLNLEDRSGAKRRVYARHDDTSHFDRAMDRRSR